MADKVSLSRSQINRIRNGVSKPSLEAAEALSRHTGIEILSLMKGIEPQGEAAA